MKRDPRLVALSSDHHHALALALRATRALDGSLDVPPIEMWAEVTAAYDRELRRHFEIEERLMLPVLEAAGAKALVDRTLEEHRLIRACLLDTSSTVAERLRTFVVLIRQHVRFEEEHLFQEAQVRIPGPALQAIFEASTAAQTQYGA